MLWSIGTRWLGRATSPSVPITAESASSSGTPAATIAPNTSSRMTSVSGIDRSPACASCFAKASFSAFPELIEPASPIVKPGCRAALEFRHPSWFDEEVFGLLRKHRAALCVADAADDLEVPFVATADWGYLRLRRPDYNARALKAWAARVKAQSWRDCFVFFKHEDAGKGPQLASRLLEVLAAGSGSAAEPRQVG